MWSGSLEANVHKDFADYVDCKIHKHAALEDLRVGWWDTGNMRDNHLVRIRVLDPFLFNSPFCKKMLTDWAICAKLLPKEGILSDVNASSRTCVELLDTTAFYTFQMMQTLDCFAANCSYSRNLLSNHKKRFEELKYCKDLGEVIECIAKDEIFKIIQIYLTGGLSYAKKAIAFSISYYIYFYFGDMQVSYVIDCGLNKSEEETKKLGNAAYEKGDYDNAITLYTKISKTNKYNPIVYSNRAQAYIKLGKFHDAVVDGRRAVVLDSCWCKGYSKLVLALEGECRLPDAVSVVAFGKKLCKKPGTCADWTYLDDIQMRLNQSTNKTTSVKSEIKEKSNTKPLKTATNDLPELVSDSEDSDKEVEQKLAPKNLSVEKKPVTVKKEVPIVVHQAKPAAPILPNILDLIKDHKTSCKEGSRFLLSKKENEAIMHYQQALEILPLFNQQSYDIEESSVIVLKYSLGIAHARSGLGSSSEEAKKALLLFEDLFKKHSKLFPAVYYGLSVAFVQMFRYDEALKQINDGIAVIQNITTFSTYNWPGTDTVIEETIPDKLRIALSNLMPQCRVTPNYVCRFDDCLFEKKIFFSDPDYKGYYRICCLAQCRLEYHPQCFKIMKDNLNLSDKEFLDRVCFTPDCGNIVGVVEKNNLEGQNEKYFESETYNKSNTRKQRKSKLEKKLEQKDARKCKKKETRVHKTSESGEHADVEETNEDGEDGETQEPELNFENKHNLVFLCEANAYSNGNSVQKQDEAVLEKENVAPVSSLITGPNYEVHSKPLYVIKKDDHCEQNSENKSSDSKQLKRDKKKKKKETMSIEEFCGDALNGHDNPHMQRLNRLHSAKVMVEEGRNLGTFPSIPLFPTPEAGHNPFHIPDNLRHNMEEMETTLQQQQFISTNEESEGLKEGLYSFMRDLLKGQGPLRKDSEVLRNELSYFPPETTAFINSSGGLFSLLTKNKEFRVKNDFLCLSFQLHQVASMTSQSINCIDGFDLSDSPDDYNSDDNNDSSNNDDEDSDHSSVKLSFTSNPKLDRELQFLISSAAKDTTNSEKSGFKSSSATGGPVNPHKINPHTSSTIQNTDRGANNSQMPLKSNTDRRDSNPSPDKALKLVLENSNAGTLKHNLFQAAFKLQVSTSVLNEEEQAEIISGIFNTVAKNSDMFWDLLNRKLIGVSAASISADGGQENKPLIDLKRKYFLESQKTQEKINSLEDRLTSASDMIVKLQRTSAATKKALEEEKSDLQECCKQLENDLKTNQAQIETERKRLQQDKIKIQEEVKMCKKEKEAVDKMKQQIEDLSSKNESLKSLLSKEQRANNQVQQTIITMLGDIEDGRTKYAKAQTNMITIRKTDGLREIDVLLDQANLATQHLRTNHVSVNFNTEAKLKEVQTYTTELQAEREKFLKSINDCFQMVKDRTEVTVEKLPILDSLPKTFPQLLNIYHSNKPNPALPTTMAQNRPSPISSAHYLPPPIGTPRQTNQGLLPFPQPSNPGLLQHPTHQSGLLPPPNFGPHMPNFGPLNQPFHFNGFQAHTKGPPPNFDRASPFMHKGLDMFLPHPNIVPAPAQNNPPKPPSTTRSAYDRPEPITITASPVKTVSTGSNPARGAANPIKPPPPLLSTVSDAELAAENIRNMKLPAKSLKVINPTAQKSSFEKLVDLIKEKLPKMTNTEIGEYVKMYRSQKQKLSGMSIDQIVDNVVALIIREKKAWKGATQSAVSAMDKIEAPTAVGAAAEGSSKSWGKTNNGEWSKEDDEDNCCICFEFISEDGAFKLECGHTFHKLCMNKWMHAQSTCPICRKHILLPEEYPALGM